MRRINKAYRLAEEVEVEEVFQKSDLEKVMFTIVAQMKIFSVHGKIESTKPKLQNRGGNS